MNRNLLYIQMLSLTLVGPATLSPASGGVPYVLSADFEDCLENPVCFCMTHPEDPICGGVGHQESSEFFGGWAGMPVPGSSETLVLAQPLPGNAKTRRIFFIPGVGALRLGATSFAITHPSLGVNLREGDFAGFMGGVFVGVTSLPGRPEVALLTSDGGIHLLDPATGAFMTLVAGGWTADAATLEFIGADPFAPTFVVEARDVETGLWRLHEVTAAGVVAVHGILRNDDERFVMVVRSTDAAGQRACVAVKKNGQLFGIGNDGEPFTLGLMYPMEIEAAAAERVAGEATAIVATGVGGRVVSMDLATGLAFEHGAKLVLSGAKSIALVDGTLPSVQVSVEIVDGDRRLGTPVRVVTNVDGNPAPNVISFAPFGGKVFEAGILTATSGDLGYVIENDLQIAIERHAPKQGVPTTLVYSTSLKSSNFTPMVVGRIPGTPVLSTASTTAP